MWTCPKCRQKVDDAYEVCWACGTTVDGVEDPQFFDEPAHGPVPKPEGESPENLVTVAKCSLPGEAHAIRMRLESEGIPVFLFDEFTITMDWLLSNAIGGVKVQVPDHSLARARQILGIMEEEEQEAERAAAEEDQEPDTEDSAPSDSDEPPEEGIMDPERT
jgi:hypothetical protein